MNNEIHFGNEKTDIFLEKLKLVKLESRSRIYRALEEARKIGLDCLIKYKPRSGLLSGIDNKELKKYKEGVVENNGNDPVFIVWFDEACSWITREQGTSSSNMIVWKLGFLEDKIREANRRTDLV